VAAKKTSTSTRTSKRAKSAPESRVYKRARKQAEQRLKDPKKTRKLADDAERKLRDQVERVGDAVDELGALIRMIRAYAKGEYRDVPWTTLAAAGAAIVYFVSPIDVIPDPIPVVGLSDDVVVVLFVVAAIKHEIDAFERWEEQQAAKRRRAASSRTRPKSAPSSRKKKPSARARPAKKPSSSSRKSPAKA
jgi:uncharacterized membrane protein YkvA (DUF1232 family)